MKSASSMLYLLITGFSLSAFGQRLVYISPVPDSKFVSLQTNIILRCDTDVDRTRLSPASLEVRGTESGLHTGSLTISDDGQTILFTPDRTLEPGESVQVTLHEGIKTVNGDPVRPVTFAFTTTPLRVPLTERYYVNREGAVVSIEEEAISSAGLRSAPAIGSLRSSPDAARTLPPAVSIDRTASLQDTLPADFPTFKVDTTNNPAPGYYFLAVEETHTGVGYFIFMLDNNGKVVRYKRTPDNALDFKQHPNGLLSYAEPYSPWTYAGGSRTVHRVMDSTLAPVDSFRCGNGYEADSHEFLMLPNGHVMLHAYDIQYMDLSGVVAGGNPNAIVVGSILQELDLNKNVVFQWRSWDYVPIADTYNNVASAAFDYIHVNGYDLDGDGNILACFRVTCQVLKINRMTGEIMWRLGGKQNEFTFIGEDPANAPIYISFPHSVRRLPNGNLLLFDNGNHHPVQASRAVEYQIDQVNKTATVVWQYRHTPDLFGPQMGSVQRLPNGNTLIGWGNAAYFSTGKQAFTEVRPDKSIAFEMEFLDGTITYRAWKHVLAAQATAGTSINVFDVQPGNTYYFKRGDSVLTGVSMYIVQGSTGYSNVSVKYYTSATVKPEFTGLPPFVQSRRWVLRAIGLTGYVVDVTFDSTALGLYTDKSRAVVYARDVEGTGTFAALPTVYDSVKRSLTVTVSKFGEFIIGVPEQVTAPPVPGRVNPEQNATVDQTQPVLIRWSPAGHLTGSFLQVATDSLFVTPVVNDSTLKSSAFMWTGAANGTTYFWRAQAENELGRSGWSSVGRFTAAPPFITVTAPQAKTRFAPGATTLIRWDSNLKIVGVPVSIRLYRSGVFAARINDSTANTGRYSWRIGATLATDSTYTVRVRLFSDSTLFSESAAFTIAPTTDVEEEAPVISTYELDQNYPNPFNPGTTIRFRVPDYGLASTGHTSSAGQPGSRDIRLAVYDLLGREVAILAEGTKESGEHIATFDGSRFSTGVYFYRLMVRGTGGNGTWQTLFTRTMVMVK